jgi:hypothetical protein
LKNGREPVISAKTYKALEQVIRADGSKESRAKLVELGRAVQSYGGVDMAIAYGWWNRAKIREFLHRRTLRYETADEALVPIEGLANLSGRPFEPLPDPVIEGEKLSGAPFLRYTNLVALRARIGRLPAAKRLARFEAALEESDQHPLRFDVALLNILGPILEGPESALVEVQWEELLDEDLNRFVLRGVEREEMLLRYRGPRTQRIQKMIRIDSPRAIHQRTPKGRAFSVMMGIIMEKRASRMR